MSLLVSSRVAARVASLPPELVVACFHTSAPFNEQSRFDVRSVHPDLPLFWRHRREDICPSEHCLAPSRNLSRLHHSWLSLSGWPERGQLDPRSA
ncbi:hypothetical protein BD310DRAFT_719748 [Dichomitus squalens]|uniref:Uncharacterized protein n=1 Tax=Dichomitus squalens TaxID=114155 RepID=A0A4Q9PLF3_9APHY|nr:hypothetical protein BD310DRAFT_719748 [Dichomitus squalens]